MKKYQSRIALAFIIISLFVYLFCVFRNIYDTFKALIESKQENALLSKELENKSKNKKGFAITYNDEGMTATYNGEYQNDLALKKLISGALDEYQGSSEEQKEKWRKEWEEELLNSKW